MIRKFLSSQEKSSGSFFLVLMAGVFQQSIHKFHKENFSTGLFFSVLALTIPLAVSGLMMYFLLAPSDLSAKKLTILVKSQQIRVRNYDIIKMYLIIVPTLACTQYFLRRNETDLAFWNFLLSTAVSISLGFLARSICSHFLNRRIRAELNKTHTTLTSP